MSIEVILARVVLLHCVGMCALMIIRSKESDDMIIYIIFNDTMHVPAPVCLCPSSCTSSFPSLFLSTTVNFGEMVCFRVLVLLLAVGSIPRSAFGAGGGPTQEAI